MAPGLPSAAGLCGGSVDLWTPGAVRQGPSFAQRTLLSRAWSYCNLCSWVLSTLKIRVILPTKVGLLRNSKDCSPGQASCSKVTASPANPEEPDCPVKGGAERALEGKPVGGERRPWELMVSTCTFPWLAAGGSFLWSVPLCDSQPSGRLPLLMSQCGGSVVSAGRCWAGRTEKQDLVTLRGCPQVAVKLGQR